MMTLWASPWPYALAIIASVIGWVLVHVLELQAKERAMAQALKDSSPDQRVPILEAAPAILRELSTDHGRPGLRLGSREARQLRDRDTR